jgi:RNA polymerase sigma-70 factor, ECF subfamily
VYWNTRGNMTAASVSSRGCSPSHETWRSITCESNKRRRQGIGWCREDEAGLNLPAPDFESPFFAAARSEDAKRIAAALGALEPIYREALLLRFQEELSLAEIAQVAGAPMSTVSSRIHRGLSMLQASLGGGTDAA